MPKKNESEISSSQVNASLNKPNIKQSAGPTLMVPGSSGSNINSESTKSVALIREGSKMILDKTQTFFHASKKSKFCKKVYRSNDAIEEEQQRQIDLAKFVIHPFSMFRWYWDMLMVSVLIVTLIMLPYVIAFDLAQLTTTWMVINLVFDALFLIDICLNFRTGIVNQRTEEVILEPKKIAWSYCKTWFLVDLVSSLPFDEIYVWTTGEEQASYAALHLLKALRLTKFLSLLKILRMARLLRYIYKMEEILDIDASVIRIFNLIMMVLVMSHWNGCMQFFIMYINDFPADSWVTINNLHLPSATNLDKYTHSLFRAMSQMVCIGFGSDVSRSPLEIWCTIFSMMMGATLYCLFIVSTNNLIQTVNRPEKTYNKKIAQAKEYMRYRRVPYSLQKRVLDYYDHKYQRKYFDEELIAHEPHMSNELKKEIMLHNCKPLVDTVDFLAQGSSDFVCDVIMKMHFEVYLPGDRIIQAGKKGDSMYFIEHGKVEVVLPNGEVVNRLGDGQHFGEIALLMDERRVASVVALEMCDLYLLSRENFKSVLTEYPQMGRKIESVAQARLESIRKDYPELYDTFSEKYKSSQTSTIPSESESIPLATNSTATTDSSVQSRKKNPTINMPPVEQ
ncbi:unnamed protein product [Owenia fusiformis]|uniref:Uncharacterized protein n=1 Tax=Owenia fusiformis TaxID=6347 RepID=A0A8J1UFV6_OWEFU|nr:unnamed protein product [Owenia fusiformis]